MRPIKLNRITAQIENGNYSDAIFEILNENIEDKERKNIHDEIISELRAYGYFIYKPDNIIGEEKITEMMMEIIPDYQKCNPPIIF
jgi:hypothetical protein